MRRPFSIASSPHQLIHSFFQIKLTIFLAKRGYNVSAFDYSREQVNLARKKARENCVKIDFYVGDIRNFSFGKYDAVISMYAPIMFGCRNKKDLTQALHSMKKALTPSGIALVETMTPKMLEGSRIEVKKYVDTKIRTARISFYTFDKKNKRADVTYVELVNSNGRTVVDEYKARHRYFNKNDFRDAFKKIDAKSLKWYGAFNKKTGKYDSFSENSWVITSLFQ